MFLILREVLRADFFDLLQFLVVLFLHVFAVSRRCVLNAQDFVIDQLDLLHDLLAEVGRLDVDLVSHLALVRR